MASLSRATITVITKTPDLEVGPGEWVGVWLGRFEDPQGRTQVELAVLPDGTRRICLPAGVPVVVTTFEKAYAPHPSPEEEPPSPAEKETPT